MQKAIMLKEYKKQFQMGNDKVGSTMLTFALNNIGDLSRVRKNNSFYNYFLVNFYGIV